MRDETPPLPPLADCDYAQPGEYFITVCVKDMRCVLGQVVGEAVTLSAEGEVVQAVWKALPEHFKDIELDEFVVMPNHVHGIVWIKDTSVSNVGARHASPLQKSRGFKPGSLSAIVASFKSAATRRINTLRNTPGAKFWQRSFYEHILRDDEGLHNHRQYIQDNPLKLALDEHFLEANYG